MNLNQPHAAWLFRDLNRRIDNIHLRSRRNDVKQRFDIVIAQTNAAGADAHADAKIRVRTVQQVHTAICGKGGIA